MALVSLLDQAGGVCGPGQVLRDGGSQELEATHRFITLRLNHCWQMNYSDDVFHTFLDLDTVIYLSVYETVSSLLKASSKIS